MGGKAKRVSGERVFEGQLLAVDVDQVIEPETDSPARREVVRHQGAAAVVPCLPGAKIILVRQYRYPPDTYLWEIPAGILEPGEKPEECAERELREETGYNLGLLKPLAWLHSSPGFSDEVIHLFRADNIKPGTARPDPEERLEVKAFDLLEAVDMISEGRITDSKTIAGILLVARNIATASGI
ncbi:MAG TPA: NUDIX hydrolase [archaeon]|nr:NUDIX hydrolase [archaeon]